MHLKFFLVKVHVKTIFLCSTASLSIKKQTDRIAIAFITLCFTLALSGTSSVVTIGDRVDDAVFYCEKQHCTPAAYVGLCSTTVTSDF